MKALSRVIGSEEGRRANHGNNALRNLIEERGGGYITDGKEGLERE
jgi:hypothetical protein